MGLKGKSGLNADENASKLAKIRLFWIGHSAEYSSGASASDVGFDGRELITMSMLAWVACK